MADMQQDLICLGLGLQVRSASIRQNPLPKPIPTDTTGLQRSTGPLRRNTSHYQHRILMHFRGHRQSTNNVSLYYRLLSFMTNSSMSVTW